jgi:sugar phosphate permease
MPGAERLAAILIILPFLTAIVCYWVRISGIRSFVVLLTGGLLITSAVLLILLTPFSFWPQPALSGSIHTIVQVLDFLLLLVVLYFGFKHHHILIKALALLPILFLLYFAFSRTPKVKAQRIRPSVTGIVCR